MKYIVTLMVIIGLTGAVTAGEMSVQEWEKYNQDAALFLSAYADSVASGQALPIKCLTPFFLGLQNSQPQGMALSPAFTSREDTMSFTYGTTHFLIHYTDNGANTPYQYSQQDSLPGTPDYIFETGKIAEQVYAKYMSMAYDPPPSDGAQSVNGGDGRYDIYIINFGAYGATVRDSFLTPVTATSYVFVENDYDGFPGYENSRLDAMRVGLAHEFFHSIQFGYDISELEATPIPHDVNASWMEMSAVYMEEVHYDYVNDYLGYLPFFYNRPNWSLRFGTYQGGVYAERNLHMYGSVVWPLFLDQNFPSFIDSTIVHEIWDSCRAVPGPNWMEATNSILKRRTDGSDSLASMFSEFIVWNLFTGLHARSGEFFEEASSFNSLKQTADINSYPATVELTDSLLPDNLGADYIFLNNTSSINGVLTLTFNAQMDHHWAMRIVGVSTRLDSGDIWIDPNVYTENDKKIVISNPSSFKQIILIPAVLNGNDSTVSYSLIVSPGEGVTKPNGGEVWYAGDVDTISWAFPDSVLAVDIEFSSDGGETWSDITRVPNGQLLYPWTVPSVSSTRCLIRITDSEHPNVSDTSDGFFTIAVVGENRVEEPYPNPAWAHLGNITFKAVISPATNNPSMKVTILNLAGEKVRDNLPIANGNGEQTIEWDYTNNDGEIVAAGPYLAIINISGETFVKKFMVLR